MPKEDKRVAVGNVCTWWDSATKAIEVGGMFLCPHCEKACNTVESEENFFRGLNDRPKEFCDFVKWSRGKCHKNFEALILAYMRETRKPDPRRAG